tara:strand:+ start:76206 stop:76556 length:351 start_codon:yes stop_codon:yes gene_type:complete
MLKVLLFLLSADVVAQGATPAQVNPIQQFAPFILVFLVFYFLMIRPQKKKLEQEQSMLGALGKGDEIYTKSGMLGTIYGMTEKVITLEITEGVKIKVLRSQIGGLSSKLFEKKESK